MRKYISMLILSLVFAPITLIKAATEPDPEIGLKEKPGNQLPLDLSFMDSDGNTRQLKEIITKPTVLTLVYYHCPGVCSPMLTNLVGLLDEVKLEPGKDFQVLTISFNHHETMADAAKWKKNYLSQLKRHFDPKDWIFMTGDSLNINKLTRAAGFFFKTDGPMDYTHPATLIILTPQGKIARYLPGTDFLPFDFKLGIIEASKGKAMPSITKFLTFCYSYEPGSKRYVFNITKVAGTIVGLGVGILFIVLVIMGKVKKSKGKV